MMFPKIPKNQVTSANTISQREHEDNAAARRVVAVDAEGEFHDETNPSPAIQFFLRNGAPQAVVEDTVNPSNNRPLPVKLTGFDGDVVINPTNLNLETQNDGLYDAVDNVDPDSSGLIAHQRSAATDETHQVERVTAKRGALDTDTVSQDVSLHDHNGDRFTETNQFPANASIRDGVNPAIKAKVSLNKELHTNDSVNSGAQDTTIPLTAGSPQEGKVGAVKRVNRKYVWMMGITTPPGANPYIIWGFSSTTQNFKLFKDQLLCFPIGEGTEIWFNVPSGTGSVAFGEGS